MNVAVKAREVHPLALRTAYSKTGQPNGDLLLGAHTTDPDVTAEFYRAVEVERTGDCAWQKANGAEGGK